MPAYDAEMMFKTTGTLTQNGSLGPIKVWGGIRMGLAARVVVPSANGINDTMLPKIYSSDDNSTYNLVSQYAGGATKIPTGGMEFIIPFIVKPGKQYIKLELIGTAASTTYSFGAVTAGIVQNPGFDWERSSNFE